jgi:hypothetical protein
MRTTLNLSDDLIAELMRVSGLKTKTEAIHLAISEFIRRKKLRSLMDLSGKVRIDPNWQEAEETELKAQERRERTWHGRR